MITRSAKSSVEVEVERFAKVDLSREERTGFPEVQTLTAEYEILRKIFRLCSVKARTLLRLRRF
jgi:NCAIR mutase (PurE)-related protein